MALKDAIVQLKDQCQRLPRLCADCRPKRARKNRWLISYIFRPGGKCEGFGWEVGLSLQALLVRRISLLQVWVWVLELESIFVHYH
jgi:hypothetical protein